MLKFSCTICQTFFFNMCICISFSCTICQTFFFNMCICIPFSCTICQTFFFNMCICIPFSSSMCFLRVALIFSVDLRFILTIRPKSFFLQNLLVKYPADVLEFLNTNCLTTTIKIYDVRTHTHF